MPAPRASSASSQCVSISLHAGQALHAQILFSHPLDSRASICEVAPGPGHAFPVLVSCRAVIGAVTAVISSMISIPTDPQTSPPRHFHNSDPQLLHVNSGANMAPPCQKLTRKNSSGPVVSSLNNNGLSASLIFSSAPSSCNRGRTRNSCASDTGCPRGSRTSCRRNLRGSPRTTGRARSPTSASRCGTRRSTR